MRNKAHVKMIKRSEELKKYFKERNGIAAFADINKAGFHHDTVEVLLKNKTIEKVKAGLYKMSGYEPRTYPDLVNASLQVPQGVICLLSALSFYEVTSEIPRYVHMAIQQGSYANKIKYPPVKIYRFSKKAWEAGVEIRDIEGHKVRIYGLTKTIADCFKFRNKIGINIVRDALKNALSERRVNPVEIMQYAKICRVDKILKPILEAII